MDDRSQPRSVLEGSGLSRSVARWLSTPWFVAFLPADRAPVGKSARQSGAHRNSRSVCWARLVIMTDSKFKPLTRTGGLKGKAESDLHALCNSIWRTQLTLVTASRSMTSLLLPVSRRPGWRSPGNRATGSTHGTATRRRARGITP
jgi:hypothetical protein